MMKRMFGLVSSAAAATTAPMNIAATAASVREIIITYLIYIKFISVSRRNVGLHDGDYLRGLSGAESCALVPFVLDYCMLLCRIAVAILSAKKGENQA